MRMSHGAGYVCSGSTSSTESEATRPTFYGSWKLQHGIATNQAASLHLERTDLAYGQAWWAKPGYSPKAVIAGCCLLDCRWRMEFRKLGRGRLAKHRITCRALCRNSCSCCMCCATYKNIYIYIYIYFRPSGRGRQRRRQALGTCGLSRRKVKTPRCS